MLKHNDNLESKEKVKYDLYKILRMSILLNQNEVDKITLDKFREASLNIDKMLGEEYDEKLDTMFYDTTTLEEEESRLKALVSLVTERIEKRKNLLEDYRSVTNRELDDLEFINKSNDLDLFESRLKLIKEYLDNSKLIEVNEKELEKIKDQLVEEYDLKASNELKNVKLEDNLYNSLKNALYDKNLYSLVESTDLDAEIESIQNDVKEAKEQKDTFEAAFGNLKSSGISGELEVEYASYVENAKKNYYDVKEKEIIFKLYKLIQIKEAEYIDLFMKREEVKSLLEERLLLRKDLNLKDKDFMSDVYDLVSNQKQEIEVQKDNVDNINVLTERIKLKENRLEELRKSLKRPEILSLLKEFGLIETYDEENVFDDNLDETILASDESVTHEEENKNSSMGLLSDLLSEEELNELNSSDMEIPEDEVIDFNVDVDKEYLPNQIKSSLMVPTMNFGLSRLKSISVMKRVSDMLGISAKVSEVVEEEKMDLPKEEIKSEPTVDLFLQDDSDGPLFVDVPSFDDNNFEENKEEDLFWTPNEILDINNDFENNSESVSLENNNNDDSIFEFKMPEINEGINDNQDNIFENENDNKEFIFPEPVMPDLDVLPKNNEDKFIWPENLSDFDINGIFPN